MADRTSPAFPDPCVPGSFPPRTRARTRVRASVALAPLLIVACAFAGPASDPATIGRDQIALWADSANAFYAAGRHGEALRYAERVVHWQLAQGPVNADFFFNYLVALHNAALESGVSGPATRSSIERIAIVTRALEASELSLGRASNRAQAARALAARGDEYAIWGFERDAELCYRVAASVDPALPGLDARQRAIHRGATDAPARERPK